MSVASRCYHLINKNIFSSTPLLAAVVFGSWAAFVNSEYGLLVLIRSGLGQGIYAFFATWIVTRTATNAFAFAFAGDGPYGLVMSFVASFLVMISFPLTIHHALGTPEILNAILPGVLWGSGYIVTYLWFLERNVPERSS